MKINSQNDNLTLRSLALIPSVLFISYWFYNNILLGYFLSKIFNTIYKNNISKRIQLRKKFHFKTIVDFCRKFIQNWLIRIFEKSLLLVPSVRRLRKAIQKFSKTFLKYPFRFKRNVRKFISLMNIFRETFLVFNSVINEILFFNNLIKWLTQWRNFIRVLTEESKCITTIVYALYFIILGIFGLFLGFVFGIYRRNNEIDQLHLFFLLLLLQIFSQKRFYDMLLYYLFTFSLALKIVEPLENFSFEPLLQIENRSFKMNLKETDQLIQIPFPIFDDPSPTIQIDCIWNESFEYKFELFKVYQTLNEKVNL